MAISFKGNAAAAAADNQYPVAPEGTYFLVCVDAKEKTAKSGRAMMELELVISEGDYADSVHVWHYLTFIEEGAKGHGITLHTLKAFGLPFDGENEYSAEQFVGMTVKAELKQETYQGRLKNVVDKFITEEEHNAQQAATQTPPAQPPVKSPAQSLASKPAQLATATAGRKPAPWAGKR